MLVLIFYINFAFFFFPMHKIIFAWYDKILLKFFFEHSYESLCGLVLILDCKFSIYILYSNTSLVVVS